MKPLQVDSCSPLTGGANKGRLCLFASCRLLPKVSLLLQLRVLSASLQTSGFNTRSIVGVVFLFTPFPGTGLFYCAFDGCSWHVNITCVAM